LVDALRKSQLLEPNQLDELRLALQPRYPDARALAGELIRRNWLTPYQINQLFQEHGQTLSLGQYVLLERLGEGGMGQVFKARHRSLGRIVALKIVRKERLVKPEVVRRFHREVQAAAQLEHPNVVRAFDADHIGNTLFIAMEYVEGIDLLRLVKTRGPLPIDQACAVIIQTAQGLQHAHERGLVHRDIKPANLLVTQLPGLGPKSAAVHVPTLCEQKPGQGDLLSGVDRGPLVKILDMGLARINRGVEDEREGAVTQLGALVGTIDYLAPEQAQNASSVDIRADIYSLGCTFYYLLTGKVPFTGRTAMEKLIKLRMEEPPPVELLRPEVSPSLALVVRKMMAKHPEERYRTPVEVANALKTLASMGGLTGMLAVSESAAGALPQAIPLTRAGTGPPSPPEAVPVQEAMSHWEQLTLTSVEEPGRPLVRLHVRREKPSWVVRVGLPVLILLVFLVILVVLLFQPEKVPGDQKIKQEKSTPRGAREEK
jgi:serine/threonine-protein kinase